MTPVVIRTDSETPAESAAREQAWHRLWSVLLAPPRDTEHDDAADAA